MGEEEEEEEEVTEETTVETDVETIDDTTITTTSQRADDRSWKSMAFSASAACTYTALLLAYMFVFMGLFAGWDEAKRSVLNLSMYTVTWLVLSQVSMDRRLMRNGIKTQATITNRKEQETTMCCIRSKNAATKERYIQYTYCIDGVTYENDGVWFQFSEPKVWDQFSEDDPEHATRNNVDIKYMPGRPEISLPTNRKGIIVLSAGSLNGMSLCSWSFLVYLVLVVSCDTAALLAIEKLDNSTNELLRSFLAHLVGLPISGLLYYYCWMRRCERSQHFKATHPVQPLALHPGTLA